ncbi:OsmC family protein [Coralloluteibacterium stylophorae]|uniref:OsmC family protein n=1 Tax=Coralloluteibacterium stylophorae TaxID=1776034 RepID=A0AAP2C8Q1_9GAMM|nr:OsmC family protein [Coralloluteibacterium stylophorae]MBS7455944.1 OsmC family protein [Coralloluteibacterium stylophorae]
MARKATAIWNGNGKEGKGQLSTESKALDSVYGAKARFEDGPGTNPEELLAAAHAGCFTMATAFALEKAGYAADELHTDCAISLKSEGEGFRITASALTMKAKIPGIGEDEFQKIAQAAKEGCPVSKLFDTEITLQATLG